MIGSFRQHTSRDGDPQLHVHNLVLNKVETERDGRWRKLDSRSLYRFQGAAAAIAAAVMESVLTREFGVAWAPRADGHGREIAGISQELMDAFSSRRQAITAEARAVAAEREAQTGRPPDARQVFRIQKDIAYRTRAAKPEAPLDIRAKVREWEQTAREHDLGELSAIPAAVAEAARAAREREQQAERDAADPVALRVAQAIAGEFGRQHGRAPEARELEAIERFARFVTLNGADARPVDPALLLKGWHAQERADAEARRGIPARDRPGAGPVRRAAEPSARACADGGVPGAAAAAKRGSGAVRDGRGDRSHAGTDNGLDQGGPDPLSGRDAPGRGAGRPPRPGDSGCPLDQRRGRRAGGAAVRAGMAARPRRAAPGGRRVGVPAARRRTIRKQARLTWRSSSCRTGAGTGAPRLNAETAARLLGANPERLQAQLQPGSAATAEAETAGSRLRIDRPPAAPSRCRC